MKGKFIKFIAIMLAVVGFIMANFGQVIIHVDPIIGSSYETTLKFADVVFGTSTYNGVKFILYAYLLIAAGAFLLAMTGYFNLKGTLNIILTSVCAVAILVGGISLFCMKDLFYNVQTDAVKELWNSEISKTTLSLTAAPVIGGILCVLSSLLSVASSIMYRK